ncbi:MAG: right-handed parallel beta-helix repeat-containing protein, partial [Planctomycetia bacterium]|nr:right-handed parallel beta-helix repeat-containing protein [Planctomycetia bacterium]
MILTSWVRALSQKLLRRRSLNRARRSAGQPWSPTTSQVRMAETLEERTLLTALVIDSNTFGSTPGVNINITNASLDANSDGVSDYDNLVIASSDLPIVIGPAGVGIRINLSNLTGLRNITIDNVTITAGAGLQGIDIDINNILLESLTVDQVTVNTTNANGIDINLQNIGTVAGADVTVKDSTVRSTGVVAANTPATGVLVTLGSTTKTTHLNSLTIADSTVQGIGVVSTANTGFQTLVDQSAAKNNRVQDVNGVASPITYNFTRTTVGDLRVDDNLLFRNVSIAATNSPLGTVGGVTIDNNTNIDLTAIGATTTGISLTATSTNAVGTLRSDVTNLHISGNTLNGNQVNTRQANGISLTLTDSNLGSYTNNSAGATIADNTLSNLSSNTGASVGIQITASASAAFVAGNDVATVGNDLPLLLDLFNGSNKTGVHSTAAGDLNGITGNTLQANNGRGLSVSTTANTTFLADVTNNTIDGGIGASTAANRREAVSMTFTDKPTAAGFDSFNLNFSGNTVNRSAGATAGLTSAGTAVGLTMVNTAAGAFVIQNNVITNTSDSVGGVPNGLGIYLASTSGVQQATNLLRKSFIEDNLIGVTAAGVAGRNNANGVFIDGKEQSEIQDLQIRRNTIANSGQNAISFLREDEVRLTTVKPEADQTRAVTIADNNLTGSTFHGILLDARNGSTDLLDFEIRGNTLTNNRQTGIHLIAEADARMLVDIIHNDIEFSGTDGIRLDTVQTQVGGVSTDKRQIGGTWIKNTISNNTGNGISILGRHGLYDEATGSRTALLIGEEGTDPADGLSRGNVFQSNGNFGVQVNVNGSNNGDVGITNNTIGSNLAGGVVVNSANELVAIKQNTITANQGIGLNLISPGTSSIRASIRDNLISSQINSVGGTVGDGVQLSALNSFGFLSVLMTNNVINNNAGRGIDVLNGGFGPTTQLQIGDGTVEGRNSIIGNTLEGVYVVNSSDGTQSQNVPSSNAMSATGDPNARPNMMLNVDRNTIKDNGIGDVASQFNGTGLVLRVGNSGSDVVDPFSNTITGAGSVGTNSGNAGGNGRVNARVTNNSFEGNYGNDFYVMPFVSALAGNDGTQWDTNGFNPNGLQRDALSRLNMVFTGNTGNGMNVQDTSNAFYSNNEPIWKSRSNDVNVANPPGPFGNTARARMVTYLRGAPQLIGPGFTQFAFEDGGASTWRVETGFDTSGRTSNFAFYNPNAGNGGSQNNFSDATPIPLYPTTRNLPLWAVVPAGTFTFPNVDAPTLGTAGVSIPLDPSPVAVSQIRTTFTEYVAGVDIADFQLLSHTIHANLTSSIPVGTNSFVVSNASVFPATPFNVQLEGETLTVTGVNVGTNSLTLLNPSTVVHNGSVNNPLEVAYVVPLVDALNAPLTVVPDASTQDPNNLGAFKSYTIDLSFPTATTGSYELRVVNTDNASGTVTATTGNGVTPIVITSPNHGLTSGRRIVVSGVQGNTAANGAFTVNVIDANSFQLVGSTGNGVYTGGGVWSTSVRDVILQAPVGAQPSVGNPLTPVVDNNGVLQNYTTFLKFSMDNVRPIATISPVMPDPRNSAAGIVTVTFNEPVTGVDISDFVLLRGGQPVNLGSVTVNPISATQYELNLNQLTGAAGSYELRLVTVDEPATSTVEATTPITDLAENLVAENFAVGIAASDSWVVDTVLPVVTTVVKTPASTPSNVPVSTVLINFNEAVSGVSIGDLTLTLTDASGNTTPVNIGAIPLIQNTTSQYELNLSTFSGIAGTYRLTVNPVNSGIFDTANNAFETTFTATWVLDLSAPTADVVDVAPDPRQAPVDALNTIFSEPISGLTLGQYVLAFDDGTPANGNVVTGALNAPTITVTSPNHGLSNGTQITIYGVSGNTNANGVFTVQNVTTNTFQLFDYATGLVPVPGNAVYVSGGRWARNMIGLGASTLTQESSLRHVVDLQTVTNNPGIYVVSLLSNAGAVDASGNVLQSEANKFNVAAQDIWTYGPDVPPMGTITPVATPIGTNAGVVVINFSEPLAKVGGTYPIDINDFRLRRDTGSGFVNVPLTGATIVQLSATSFSIDLTGAGITDVNGNYELSLVNTDAVSPIKDLAGNLMFDAFSPGSGIASQVTWTKVFSDPSVTSIKGVFTDPMFDTDPVAATKLRAVQNLTINFSTTVTGINLADASKNFRLTRQSLNGTDTPLPVSLDGVTVTRITATQYRINLSTLTGTDGKYAFTVLANGLIQNSGFQPLLNARTISWSKDATIRPNQFSDSVDAIGTSGQVLGNEVVDSSASAGFQISLRAAIQEANALAGDDVIELGVGTYVLTLGGVQEDNAVSGDLDIRGLDSLIIRGKGIGQTIIDASGLPAATRDRIFQVMAGASLTLQGVTLQGGSVLGSEDGGAIRNTGTLTILDSEIRNNASQDTGGAIINTGTMTINRTTISGNTATATGGAILNTATMTILNSTLNNNTATSNGGAIANIAGATATLEGVTVAANRSTSGAGGGIRNDGTLRLINDTIAFNQSLQAGAGVSRNAGTVTVGNTIISDNFLLAAGNAQSDVAGTFTSSGNNIVRTVGAAVGFTGPGDQV